MFDRPLGKATVAPNLDGDGNPANDFVLHVRFPGQYFDGESGYHYNHFRDYDPATGRYLEADPIGQAGGLNPYQYGDGDPIGRTDPSGLEAVTSRYPTRDAAANAALGDINPVSIRLDAEYCGWIYPNADGTYSYTTATTSGERNGVDCPPMPAEVLGLSHARRTRSRPRYYTRR